VLSFRFNTLIYLWFLLKAIFNLSYYMTEIFIKCSCLIILLIQVNIRIYTICVKLWTLFEGNYCEFCHEDADHFYMMESGRLLDRWSEENGRAT